MMRTESSWGENHEMAKEPQYHSYKKEQVLAKSTFSFGAKSRWQLGTKIQYKMTEKEEINRNYCKQS